MNDVESGLQDLSAIRSMMERASKFLSLSGLSGISAGLVALGGAWWAQTLLDAHGVGPDTYRSGTDIGPDLRVSLVLLGGGVLVLALALSIFFSSRLARRQGRAIWGPAGRHLLMTLAVPLVTGGIVTLLLLFHGVLWLVAASTLLFYGLGLYAAGSVTFGEIRTFGLLQILIGLLAAVMPGLGVLLWAVGFGLLHIGYGILLYFKYER
jgi:hypothetical protein